MLKKILAGFALGCACSIALAQSSIPFYIPSAKIAALNLTASSVQVNGTTVLSFGSSSVSVGIGASPPRATLDVGGPIKTLGYTVSTLPTGVTGMRAYVTDVAASNCTFGNTLTGGATGTPPACPVFYNGTAWVAE
ncbi:putative phage lipoprotein [Burkholderia aenigmatica]|uniref:Phage lipoprotein n=1 Tax=Burkholderia aenigmatica TaxID=2015348 RepID=A0ABY6XXY8_9BURK|nr:hypothetical protein [Burkholderia aenigmatica]VWD02488.1 putative phage lipoprotein [Burkholderia aenigmatica]